MKIWRMMSRSCSGLSIGTRKIDGEIALASNPICVEIIGRTCTKVCAHHAKICLSAVVAAVRQLLLFLPPSCNGNCTTSVRLQAHLHMSGLQPPTVNPSALRQRQQPSEPIARLVHLRRHVRRLHLTRPSLCTPGSRVRRIATLQPQISDPRLDTPSGQADPST